MKTKRTSFLARAAMTLLVTMLTATTAWAETYKITFHLNGGTYEWNIDSYDDGDIFNLMKAEREDAIFKGWYTTKTFEEGTRIADVKGRTGDLEVWAKWECDPVTYIDENGAEQTTTEYIELKGSSELAKLDDSYNWYVVRDENVVYENQFGSPDDLHIILMDGAKLTTQGRFALECDGNLFIYGQTQGTGQLVATSQYAYGLYTIGGITINGGTINATGGNFGISAIEGNVTINGGSVTAHGKDYFGIEAPNVIINGGTVTATSDTYHGISVNGKGTIAINGGSVTASHGSGVDVSYYGNVKIGPGKAYTTDTDGTIYCGTLTEDELKAIDSQTLQPTTWDGGTTAETATVLTNAKFLELLAECVNDGNSFSGKFFKLGGDITFDESNHTAIGDVTHAFAGTFDGQGHTISGLRITSTSPRQGLFGTLGTTGVVKNVTLADASIAGNDYTAGIVAYNQGTVDNCHVDNTVAVHCLQNYYDSFGGIVGYNAPNGIVSECTSSVTIALADGVTAVNHFGGIVGNNNSTVTGCIAVGVNIPDVNHHGAVVGLNQIDGILTANYYTACTVAGVDNATNVGCNSTDLDGAKSVHKLTLGNGVSTSTPATVNYNATDYYAQGTQVILTATANDEDGYTLAYGKGSIETVDNSGQFLMPADDVAAYLTFWDGEGTESSPYIIAFTTQLNLLATKTNNGNDYSGKYFKLGADITYSHTTEWNDATSTEDNYTPIASFAGSFDGDGHIISGIRIYSPGNSVEDYFKGLFSHIGNTSNRPATVKNVTLADARITGFNFTGGIGGFVDSNSTVSGCYVLNNVAIHGMQDNADAHGGIAGLAIKSKIDHCVSAATISLVDGITVTSYGGLVGQNQADLCNNLIVGATIPLESSYFGTIIGTHANAVEGTSASNNYYTTCSMGGTEKSEGVGCGYKSNDSTLADLTANDGAVPALRDGADNSMAIELLSQVPAAFSPYNVSLSGRTLWKDGDWNTICLPFDVTLAGSPLEGADVRELIPDESGLNGTTLTLNFTAANAVTELVAGKPYLIKWASGENIVNPKFTGVTIKSTTPENVASTDGKVTFKGIYSPISWDSENKSVLYLGAANTLYWPKPAGNPVNLNAFRAYFELADGVTASAFELNFDGETTGITNTNLTNQTNKTSEWYDLSGRKLDSKPTTKGVYIVNGRKVVIK
jgi:uncharacterized repeat protein (TIGR02543 family)